MLEVCSCTGAAMNSLLMACCWGLTEACTNRIVSKKHRPLVSCRIEPISAHRQLGQARIAWVKLRASGFGVKLQAPGLRLQASGLKPRASGFRLQASGFGPQPSALRPQAPGSRLPEFGFMSLITTKWFRLDLSYYVLSKFQGKGARHSRASASLSDPTCPRLFSVQRLGC